MIASLYRVRISNRALDDLRQIFGYIQQHSPQNAATAVEHILDNIDGLDLMPSRFKVVEGMRSAGLPVHAMVVRPFTVYYRVEESARIVFVLTVQHGAQQQPTHR